MKNTSISLTDQHAAEIQACIASGDYASVSEVIRAALREFLAVPNGPTMEQIDRDIREYEESMARGDRMYTIDEVMEHVRADLSE
jgi:putative addiction module CopG family antidote